MSHTQFKGVTDISQPSISEVIQDNLVTYIDHALLEIGNYINITIPTSGTYGGSRHLLHPVSDPRYTDGQVWQSYHGGWVWESGLSTGTAPIAISGVFVGSTFHANSDDDFTINYPEGKIIFDTAVATNSTVQTEFSHKWVQVVPANSLSIFQEGHTRSFRVDDSNFLVSSGDWIGLSDTRIELPVIAVETLESREYEGYQLGGGTWVRTDVVFHVLAEDSSTAKRLADILGHQGEKIIFLFDTHKMAQDNKFPLQHDGSKSSSPLTYPDLVSATGDGGYRYTRDVYGGKLRIFDTSARNQDRISHRLFHSSCRWRTECTLHKL